MTKDPLFLTRGAVIGRWFVVYEEGGRWTFMDHDAWLRSGAPIKGERINGRMMIWDSIINKTRWTDISDDELVSHGYKRSPIIEIEDSIFS